MIDRDRFASNLQLIAVASTDRDRLYCVDRATGIVTGDDSHTGAGDRTPYFEFKEAQLDDRDADGFPEYYAKNSELPLVYLHHTNYGKAGQAANVIPILNGSLQIRAYATEVAADGVTAARFADAEKFQIISAGQDNDFGMNSAMQGVYNDGRGYTDADKDKIASFSEGETLEDAMP